jgi:DNA end-binding protein Ku
MLDLAKHIVETKSGHFEPDKFEDHYEAALQDLLEKKKNGMPIPKAAAPSKGNVINLMDALKASLKTTGKSEPAEVAKPIKSAKKTAKPKRKAG